MDHRGEHCNEAEIFEFDGKVRKPPMIRVDDTTKTIVQLHEDLTGVVDPYPFRHTVAKGGTTLAGDKESVRILGVKISSRKPGRCRTIRSFKRLIRKNKDKAKTGHWF